MTWFVIRRVVLLVAFAATLPVVVVYGLETLSAVFASGAPGSDGPEFNLFITGLGLLTMTSAAVGATILWRRPGNLVGTLLLVGALMLTSVVTAWPWLTEIGPELSGPVEMLLAWWSPIGLLPAVFVLFPSVVLVFPDGQLAGRRWATAYAGLVALLVAGFLLESFAPWPVNPASGYFGNPFAVEGVPADLRLVGDLLMISAVLGGFLIALASVVVRFRRSADVERAQLKWLGAAVAINCVLFPASYVTELQPQELFDVLSVIAATLIPISIGIAVLRYRLYEIDRIISRTLSWSIVTGGVVATFAALVFALQAAFEHVTQGEALAVALSTLVAAALFQPARRRVQVAVDRRFDRATYDAQRTAAAFAERLSHSTDLDTLTDELRATVGQTVRPTATSIWLPERGQR